MKIIFAHDHRFYYDSLGNYYSPGNFHYDIWNRYLSVFEHVTVIARSRFIENPQNIKRASGPNISFVIVPNASSIKTRLFNSHKIENMISEQIKKADGLIARLPSVIGTISIKIAEKLNKPWAVEVVGCAWDSYWTHGSVVAKLYAPYAYLTTKRVISRSKFTLYVTKEFLQKRYPSFGEQINCSNVEIEKVDDKIINDKLHFLSKNSAQLKIGLIGSLATKTKGLETAFEALKYLKMKSKVPFIFEIVGDGPKGKWEKLLKNMGIKDFVVFKGRLQPGKEINEWLDQCHLYIQPSYTEGLPRALIEAMSRGCPAIASNVGGIPELLDSDFLVRPRDGKQLAHKMLKLFNNKEILLEQAKRNLKVAKEYEKAVLDAKRKNFWQKFAHYIEMEKK